MLEVTAWDDEKAYYERNTSTKPQPCLLLRKGVGGMCLWELCRRFNVLRVAHEGESRLGVLFGVWAWGVPMPAEHTRRIEAFTKGNPDFQLGEAEQLDPAGYVLSLDLTEAQLAQLRELFEMDTVVVDGVAHDRIRFAWCDVTKPPEDLTPLDHDVIIMSEVGDVGED